MENALSLGPSLYYSPVPAHWKGIVVKGTCTFSCELEAGCRNSGTPAHLARQKKK